MKLNHNIVSGKLRFLVVIALAITLLSPFEVPAQAISASDCATGGLCSIGDTGPGGGKVFYIAPTTFTQVGATGSMCTTNCKYLEAALSGWNNGGVTADDPLRTWASLANRTPAVTGADGTTIGSGYQNSEDVKNQIGNATTDSAAVLARGYAGGGKNDWYLASKDELKELYLNKVTVGGFKNSPYWTSSEAGVDPDLGFNSVWYQSFYTLESAQTPYGDKFSNKYVRPIRAFAPATKVAITRAAVGTQRKMAFTTQPQITIQFSNNDTVTASSAVVTATVSSGGTLVGTTTATASSGVATFSNLGVDGTIGTTYTISYTALDLPVASATVTLTGTNCDGTTFTCQVGDTGPGGGKIFYVAPTTFTQLGATGFMCTTACKYLEAAPTTGISPWTDIPYEWSGNTDTLIGTTGTAIGTGYNNTVAIVAQSNTPGKAATATLTYRGPNNLAGWYLPSKDELNQLCRWERGNSVSDVPCYQGTNNSGPGATGFIENYYWSSSESSATSAWSQPFAGVPDSDYNKRDTNWARPIRAFGTTPATISIANVIIPAPVTGATPVNSLTSNGQFTTAITWSGSPTTFAASTAYTATVTVTPVAGYTLSGADPFTVNGNVTNSVVSTVNFSTADKPPYAVVTDGQGNIYTVDKGMAGNATKITSQGIPLVLGTTGSMPGAVIVDFAGNVYTANRASSNVTKITAQGVSSTLGTTGTDPVSIAIDTAGNVYTANNASGNVTKITPQGASSNFAVTGSSPWGIAIDSAGNIYTSNIGSNNVTKTTPQGVSTIFGSTGIEPFAITIDSVGNVYTANCSSSNVTKITPQGASSILGSAGTCPNAIALDDAGNVYTANYRADTVTKITPQGVSTTLGTTGRYPTGITIDREGNIYTANYGSSNVTKFSSTNSGVFTYQFPATAAPNAAPVVVAVAPTPVPYLKTLTTPKLNLKDSKLICTPGTYNAGYTLDGVVQGSTTALFTPSSFTYNLLINGITQTSLAVTSSTTSNSWNIPASAAGALITCSVTVSANGVTNTDKSSDNSSGVSTSLSTQTSAINTANADYSAAVSANTKAYQKALVDNRIKWRSDIEKIRTDYYTERDRIKSLPSTKTTRAQASAALKAYTAAQKKSAADYKASQPAAATARDAANKAALDAKNAAIAKANAGYGTFIESIGYGVLIP